jgi:hypothetical protein
MPSTATLRDYFRNKLVSLLEVADDEGFLQLIWAVNMLQAGAENAAAPYLAYRYPADAVTTDIAEKRFIYKWELETLANELLTIPKRNKPKRGRNRSLITNEFNNVATAVNSLRKLENSEDGRRVKDGSIFRELARIANREFDWQRGYFNIPQFYRNAFVYAQGDCAAYFEAQHAITINKFSLVGFGIYTALIKSPVIPRQYNLRSIGVTDDEFQRCLGLMARPLSDMRALALAERKSVIHTAYRPSVFRRFPCTIFGNQSERVRSPLPQLVLERVTSGVFYDVVGGGGAVRKDYGQRFHEYCFNYLKAQLPEMDWHWEEKYRAASGPIDTPDILLMQGNLVELVVECKATRMSYSAKFGHGDQRGFSDLIKGVYQLWRFFSHCRRGIVDFTLGTDAVGIVLTLDDWLVMAKPQQEEVMAAARVMALEKDPGILPQDQKPVAFVAITSMEATLATATTASFLQAVRACAGPDYQGWMLSKVHERFHDSSQPIKSYPFRDDMARLLPWWKTAAQPAKT